MILTFCRFAKWIYSIYFLSEKQISSIILSQHSREIYLQEHFAERGDESQRLYGVLFSCQVYKIAQSQRHLRSIHEKFIL